MNPAATASSKIRRLNGTRSIVDAAPTAIERLSDKDLLSSLRTLCRQRRAIDTGIVFHLAEVERRGLHIDNGFSSLFQYCTEQLGLSRSVAGRRIQVARCARRFPLVWTALEAGTLSVAAVGHIARVAQPDTIRELVERVAGKTEAETEQIAVEYGGRVVVRESVRPIRTRARKPPVLRPASGPSATEARPGGRRTCDDPARKTAFAALDRWSPSKHRRH